MVLTSQAAPFELDSVTTNLLQRQLQTSCNASTLSNKAEASKVLLFQELAVVALMPADLEAHSTVQVAVTTTRAPVVQVPWMIQTSRV